MMYDSSDIERNWQNFFSFWTIFCPFTSNPITTQRIKILKKKKKTPGDIIILHKCTINDNHMIYGSCDMKCNRWNFLSSWAIFFALLSPPNSPKKIKNKKKKHLEILSFNTSGPKIMIICFTDPEI